MPNMVVNEKISCLMSKCRKAVRVSAMFFFFNSQINFYLFLSFQVYWHVDIGEFLKAFLEIISLCTGLLKKRKL